MRHSAAAAGAAMGVLGSVLWLIALAGGSVANPTVWVVVGVGVGAFLVANAYRYASGPPAVTPRARRLLLIARVVVAVLAVIVALWLGGGPGLLVLGGLGGIVQWVSSSVVVASAPAPR